MSYRSSFSGTGTSKNDSRANKSLGGNFLLLV
jgi:hypothetical protein